MSSKGSGLAGDILKGILVVLSIILSIFGIKGDS